MTQTQQNTAQVAVTREVEFSKGIITNIVYMVGREGDLSEPMSYAEIVALNRILAAIIERDRGQEYGNKVEGAALLYESNTSRADGTTATERTATINGVFVEDLTREQFDSMKLI